MRQTAWRGRACLVAVATAVVVGLGAVAAAVAAPVADGRACGMATVAASSHARGQLTLSISGTVRGKGGSGKYAWSVVRSGAKVSVPGVSGSTVTNALGNYSFKVTMPNSAYADYGVRASRTNYNSRELALSSDSPQTRDFVGDKALVVKGTKLKVTVKKGTKAVRNAVVTCFGKSAKSSASGLATLKGLQLRPGMKYKATVAKKGFHSATISFTSRPGYTVVKTVKIHK